MARGRDGEEAAYRRMQRRADRLCSLIVASDYPAIDLAIQIRKLSRFCEEHFPDRVELFDRIYGSRFRRLWRQFRAAEEPLPEW
jgi:hypothetical protein